MKVETREPEFKPIVIVLESREDFLAFSWIVHKAYGYADVGTNSNAMCEELISELDL